MLTNGNSNTCNSWIVITIEYIRKNKLGDEGRGSFKFIQDSFIENFGIFK